MTRSLNLRYWGWFPCFSGWQLSNSVISSDPEQYGMKSTFAVRSMVLRASYISLDLQALNCHFVAISITTFSLPKGLSKIILLFICKVQ